MENKNLRIRINLDRSFHADDLKLRYTLVDTIEDRGIGEVWEEGMGDGYLELNVELDYSEEKVQEINSILASLGLKESTELFLEELE
ncbi:hypothetical protein C9994_06500 [Marivirga lumbricoides]|uniref:FeS-binding protein n=1 Tax=Marivirga lumbricoides TaxID=1046115 RepID=A0A2T4DS22_9BACT|nr:hypothetical protein C9994_06500 [Marivirga lumbricoides]